MSGPNLSHRRSVRTTVVERLVTDAVRSQVARTGRDRLAVLDAGGGTGTVAVPLAEAGHRVTVVDPSPDSLAALERRAAEVGVRDRIHAVQGDASGLLDVVPRGEADLVFCHNVLEFVDDPPAALAAMAAATRPTGALSLLAANRHAVVLARALAGHLQQARDLLVDSDVRQKPGDPLRFTIDELGSLLAQAGYSVVATHGVRVFADLVPGTTSDGFDTLLELELAAAEHPNFRGLGAHLHVIAHLDSDRRPE